MVWDKLVQRLWAVAEFQGFSAFEDRISGILPDVRFCALLDGLRYLFHAGKPEIAGALLCEYLRNHISNQDIKERLQCFVLFDFPKQIELDVPVSDLLDELRELISLGFVDKAVFRLVNEIEENGDKGADLVFLLGRISMFKYANNKASSLIESNDLGAAVHVNEIASKSDVVALVDSEADAFVWSVRPETVFKHDEECARSAAHLQMSINTAVPIKLDAYEWGVHLDLESIQAQEIEAAVELDEGGCPSLLTDDEVSLDVLSARCSYFKNRFAQLQVQEKEMLEFVILNPKSSLAELAEDFSLTEPVVNFMTGTKLRFWLECDKNRAFSIKHSLVEFLPKSAFGKASEDLSAEGVNDNCLGHDSRARLISELELLPEDAKKVLAHFAENIGQKTHVAARALEMSHLVMLSLLNGCLDNYLDRDRAFVVTPRSGVAELLVAAGISEAIWVGI